MSETIGIIDRGVGGLGLFKKLREVSNRPIIYFADNGNAPYGLIEKSRLKHRLDHIINTLNKQGASKVVLACNSASVVYPDSDDVKGIIQFGVSSLLKAQATKPALIATRGTVESAAYSTLFQQQGLSVIEHIAQPLAIHVEQGNINGRRLEQDALHIMRPLAACDAILMACTHFPAIKPLLQRYIHPDCQLIDPVDEMSLWIEQNWPHSRGCHPPNRTQFLITGADKQLIQSAKISFGVDIDPTTVLSLKNEFAACKINYSAASDRVLNSPNWRPFSSC